MPPSITSPDAAPLDVMAWLQGEALQLGFAAVSATAADLSDAEPGLLAWLAAGFQGGMGYMAAHGLKRARPADLVPGTVSVISARMNYLPSATGLDVPGGWQSIELDRLARPGEAIVSVYARGRDYHKVLRQRLQTLAKRLAERIGPFGHRVFTDSAPVLEVELATRAGLGWRGKHTLLLSRDAGSMSFLGEIYVNFKLDGLGFEPGRAGGACGSCQSCLDVCPTQAIVAPHRLDARRCISYLTIEHAGPIPVELRRPMGNRVYGCDDCQLVCPWNKFAQTSPLADFAARPDLVGRSLLELFAWDEAAFLRHTEGSPIRRIGHERWQRNLAVAMGNALRSGLPVHEQAALRAALQGALAGATPLVAEHVQWALDRDCAQSGMSTFKASGRLAMPSRVDSVTKPAT